MKREVVESLPRQQRQRTVMAAAVQGFLSFGVKYGLDPEELCEVAGISAHQLTPAELHVPHAWLFAIRREVIARLEGVPVGLEFGKFGTFDQFGYFGQALKFSGTPLSTLRLLVQYSALIDSAQIDVPAQLIVEHDRVRLMVPGMQSDPPECVEAVFVSNVAAMRALTGTEIAPVEVHFSRSRPQLEPLFAAFFGCPVRFGSECDTIVFDRATLERPFCIADPQGGRNFLEQLKRGVSEAGDPFAVAVGRAIEALLGTGAVSQARIAKQLGMSARSLQRRLQQSEVRYQELVHAARRRSAERLLRVRASSITEVANALGYEARSFNRMFRRWTGMSPSAYRKAKLPSAGE